MADNPAFQAALKLLNALPSARFSNERKPVLLQAIHQENLAKVRELMNKDTITMKAALFATTEADKAAFLKGPSNFKFHSRSF